jgi:hypothetical protein
MSLSEEPARNPGPIRREERRSGEGNRVIDDIYFTALHSAITRTGYLDTTELMEYPLYGCGVKAPAFSRGLYHLLGEGLGALFLGIRFWKHSVLSVAQRFPSPRYTVRQGLDKLATCSVSPISTVSAHSRLD